MVYDFQDIADGNNCDGKDKGIFEDGATVSPFKYQMEAEESEHEQDGDQGGVQLKAFGKVTAEQRSHAPLHTTTRAIDTQNFFVETSH